MGNSFPDVLLGVDELISTSVHKNVDIECTDGSVEFYRNGELQARYSVSDKSNSVYNKVMDLTKDIIRQ